MSWNGLALKMVFLSMAVVHGESDKMWWFDYNISIDPVPGIRGDNPERIIGGISVHNIEHYPFVCSIRLKGAHVCGCSIISEQHVITAAHCVKKTHLSKLLQICTGDHRFEKGQQLHNISLIISHPDFSPSRIYKPINDIAIVKVYRWSIGLVQIF